jgi:hypothetical protein
MTTIHDSKESIVGSIRAAIAGVQTSFNGTKTIVIDGTPTKPTAAVATLQGAIDAIDNATAAELAYHAAVAAQHAAVTSVIAFLEHLEIAVRGTLGSTPAILGGFGFTETVPRKPTEAVKALAVQKRAATRVARGTKGPRQKAAIKGTVPSTPPTTTKPA